MRKVDTEELVKAFRVNNSNELEAAIDVAAPSMVEYTLKELTELTEEEYVNTKLIETTVSTYCGDVHFTYGGDCYIDLNNHQDISTESWI